MADNPETKEGNGDSHEDDGDWDFHLTMESEEEAPDETPDELGRTILSPAREDSAPAGQEATPSEDLLGPTLMSPPRQPSRPLGPGDTILLAPREPAEEFGFLVVWSGARRGDIHRLDVRRSLIGRDLGVQVFVDDPHVSGRHASIRCEKIGGSGAGDFVLRDLDSENGTSINGQRVSGETVLKDGDIIALGQTELVFKRV